MTTTISGSVGGVLCDGQTWQDVTSSRALGTTYTNTTGKPIVVHVATVSSNNGQPAILTVGGVAIQGNGAPSGYGASVSVIVPSGTTYSATTANQSLVKWFELR